MNPRQLTSNDTVHSEIFDATKLPAPLVSIITHYNRPDENTIRQGSLRRPELTWDGISITIDRKKYPLNFSDLVLDGIIFNKWDNTLLITLENKAIHLKKMIDNMKEWCEKEAEKPYIKNMKSAESVFPNKSAEATFINFARTSLRRAKFEHLLCTSFDFTQADLTNANFKLSVLTGTCFDGAIMENADLSFCHGDSYFVSTGFLSSKHFFTYFGNANLTRANLYGSNFRGSRFDSAILNNAILSHADFSFSMFTNCSMQHAKLMMSDFRDSHFDSYEPKRSDLSHCDATQANFARGSFARAILVNIVLDGADLTDTCFYDADLTNATLKNAIFTLSQFTPEQVLSLHYKNPDHRKYIEAIYQYMNANDKSKHTAGFKRAHALILSFIHGHDEDLNNVLQHFLDTGKIPGEKGISSSSSQNKNSLRSRLKEIEKSLSKKTEPYHDPEESKPNVRVETLNYLPNASDQFPHYETHDKSPALTQSTEYQEERLLRLKNNAERRQNNSWLWAAPPRTEGMISPVPVAEEKKQPFFRKRK